MNEMWFINLVLIAGFVFSYWLPHARTRKHMLLLNVAANFLFTSYYMLISVYAGMAACGIALISSIIQSSFSDENIDNTLMLRLGVASIMSILAIALCVNSSTDLLPILAVVMIRFAEAQKNTQFMRYGSILPMIMWVLYNYTEDLQLAMWGDALLLLSYIAGIVMHNKRQQRTACE